MFSIAKDEVWTVTVDGREVTYREVIRQEYTNALISAGTVEGEPIDTLYISLERDGKHAFFLLMRPDEFAALAWCLTGTLWTDAMAKLEKVSTILPKDAPTILEMVNDDRSEVS